MDVQTVYRKGISMKNVMLMTAAVAVTALTTNRDVTGVPIWRTDTTGIDTATTATRNRTACADTCA